MQKHYLGPRKKEIYQYFTIYVSFMHNSPVFTIYIISHSYYINIKKGTRIKTKYSIIITDTIIRILIYSDLIVSSTVFNSIKTNLKNIYIKSSKTPKTKAKNTCKKQACNRQGIN